MFVGNTEIGVPLLIVLMIAVSSYLVWRFWEAATGQGARQSYSKFKNFFNYRFAPLVSGTRPSLPRPRSITAVFAKH